jgi:hypothetical protein
MRRVIIVLFCAACGTGGDTSGPPQNAPVSGAGGFTKVMGDYVLLDSKPLTDPALYATSSSGPFAIWVTRGGTEIWRTDLARIGTDPTPLRPALAATEPWEMGSVAKPSVEHDASGYHMAYEAAGNIIALADSADGEVWTNKRMLGTGRAPSLASGFVFYESMGEIWRAPANATPALHIATGTNPDVHVRQTAGDRPIWQMYFNCTGRDLVSIAVCYGGSFDGENFSTTYIPILQPDLPDEEGPTGFVDNVGAILFFAQTPSGFMTRIAAATAP